VSTEDDDSSQPRLDDIARLRAQAEQRFVIRCSGCNREIAKSAAEEAGWRFLTTAPAGPRPCCPECVEQERPLVATCASCDSKIAASAATEFGWRYWPDESGEQRLYCPACAMNLLRPRPK
jgi:hypothetical protein